MEGAYMDYLVLVNGSHPLPEGWENDLETVRVTNSVGDGVEMEKRTHAAFLELAADLERDGIRIEPDSGLRSIETQRDIVVRFTEKYGEAYVKRYVAVPGYSEHHTGLALDLYFRMDGRDVYENEDMTRPEDLWIWEAIHAKLGDHGFILRYPDGWEDVTGYGYEPWHIRYIGDPDPAREIMEKGLTLEEFLGKVPDSAVAVGCGPSSAYSVKQIRDMTVRIKKAFSGLTDRTLLRVRYAGDQTGGAEALARLNRLKEGPRYTECAGFLCDFRLEGDGTPENRERAGEPCWAARTDGGNWEALLGESR